MGYVKIWVHLVWTPKKRKAILTKDIREKLFNHIRENARKKGIYIDFINGYTDHVHCLISLGSSQSIDAVMQLIKGESSHWVNKNKILREKFEWQREYFAVSVSESGIDRVREYIKNQQEHHKKKSFDTEYNELMKKYGFERFVSG